MRWRFRSRYLSNVTLDWRLAVRGMGRGPARFCEPRSSECGPGRDEASRNSHPSSDSGQDPRRDLPVDGAHQRLRRIDSLGEAGPVDLRHVGQDVEG